MLKGDAFLLSCFLSRCVITCTCPLNIVQMVLDFSRHPGAVLDTLLLIAQKQVSKRTDLIVLMFVKMQLHSGRNRLRHFHYFCHLSIVIFNQRCYNAVSGFALLIWQCSLNRLYCCFHSWHFLFLQQLDMKKVSIAMSKHKKRLHTFSFCNLSEDI